jgi:glutamine amidotransferase
MCELFALSSREPVGLCCSLDEFDRHGGGTAPHGDGWGLARYVDRDVLLIKEARSAHGSELARWVREHPLSSRLVIGHVRKATQGSMSYMNCQPFTRERGGVMHVFAHNGNLDAAALQAQLVAGGPQPVGDTDSERAFCVLLGGPDEGDARPREGSAQVARVADFARRMRALGPANFLYADGACLYAHGHRRMQGAQGIRPPGLWMLALTEGVASACARFVRVEGAAAGPEAPATIFASVPLSDDPRWRPLDEGELVVVRDGVVVGGTPGRAV